MGNEINFRAIEKAIADRETEILKLRNMMQSFIIIDESLAVIVDPDCRKDASELVENITELKRRNTRDNEFLGRVRGLMKRFNLSENEDGVLDVISLSEAANNDAARAIFDLKQHLLYDTMTPSFASDLNMRIMHDIEVVSSCRRTAQGLAEMEDCGHFKQDEMQQIAASLSGTITSLNQSLTNIEKILMPFQQEKKTGMKRWFKFWKH